jgi:hypothetical protein
MSSARVPFFHTKSLLFQTTHPTRRGHPTRFFWKGDRSGQQSLDRPSWLYTSKQSRDRLTLVCHPNQMKRKPVAIDRAILNHMVFADPPSRRTHHPHHKLTLRTPTRWAGRAHAQDTDALGGPLPALHPPSCLHNVSRLSFGRPPALEGAAVLGGRGRGVFVTRLRTQQVGSVGPWLDLVVCLGLVRRVVSCRHP